MAAARLAYDAERYSSEKGGAGRRATACRAESDSASAAAWAAQRAWPVLDLCASAQVGAFLAGSAAQRAEVNAVRWPAHAAAAAALAAAPETGARERRAWREEALARQVRERTPATTGSVPLPRAPELAEAAAKAVERWLFRKRADEAAAAEGRRRAAEASAARAALDASASRSAVRDWERAKRRAERARRLADRRAERDRQEAADAAIAATAARVRRSLETSGRSHSATKSVSPESALGANYRSTASRRIVVPGNGPTLRQVRTHNLCWSSVQRSCQRHDRRTPDLQLLLTSRVAAAPFESAPG
jgi:hypothetical protein